MEPVILLTNSEKESKGTLDFGFAAPSLLFFSTSGPPATLRISKPNMRSACVPSLPQPSAGRLVAPLPVEGRLPLRELRRQAAAALLQRLVPQPPVLSRAREAAAARDSRAGTRARRRPFLGPQKGSTKGFLESWL